jgi:hypothetical protein
LRKAWLARLVLIAFPLLFLPIGFLADRMNQIRLEHLPSADQSGSPIQLSYMPPNPNNHVHSTSQLSSNPMIHINIQLEDSGVAEGHALFLDGSKAEFTAPDGSHWVSSWQSNWGARVFPGQKQLHSNLMIPLDVYRKFQSMPLTVHLTHLVTLVKAEKTTTFPIPSGEFSIADFGICSAQKNWFPASKDEVTGIVCITALRQPPLTEIRTVWSEKPCSATPSVPESGEKAEAWEGLRDSDPADFGISPVIQRAPFLFADNGTYLMNGSTKGRHLCYGTPISFTQYTTVRRAIIHTSIQEYHLPQLTISGNHYSLWY